MKRRKRTRNDDFRFKKEPNIIISGSILPIERYLELAEVNQEVVNEAFRDWVENGPRHQQRGSTE